MKLGTSRRGTLLPALVAFLVLAGVGVALAGSGTLAPPRDVGVSVSDAPRVGHRDDTGPGGDVGPSGADADQDAANDDEDVSAEAACAAAVEGAEAALERAHGLERATEAIVAHCDRGHAQGLLNALARLQENKERQAEREHGAGPNEHASENAHGPGGNAGPKDEGSKDHGRPEAPGQSDAHANEHAASQGSSSH